MTGAAVLVLGLLLVLAGLFAARIPGGAAFARPGISRASSAGRLARAFLLSPLHPATWYANGALVLGFFVGALGFAFVASIASAGLTVLLAGVGIVLIAVAIEAARLIARIERWRVFAGEDERPDPHPYKPLRGAGILEALKAEFLDESRWRDVLYVGINFPLVVLELAAVGLVWSLALWLVTMPLWYDLAAAPGIDLLGALAGHDPLPASIRTLAGAALLPVAASLSQLALALHRGLVTALLCTSESRELRRQVERLRRSRSAVLDVEASELHRIERDLHDGAQQRLVMLTIDLGLAAERVEADPNAAKRLILDGQAQARQALAEIRDLVRGIAPPILVDRGLVAALESIAGRGPVAATIASGLAPGERLPPSIERAAYFVASEALANVAKHSAATRCEIRLRREPGRVVVEVWDDGTGGARLEPGGGLAGLESRLAGVDGTLSVTSPAGGPTLVRAEIPLGPGGGIEAAPPGTAPAEAPRDFWVRQDPR